MSARKAELERRLQRLIAGDLRSRVLAEIAGLAGRIRTPDGTEPTVPLSQSELAGLVGGTREPTSTALNSLQREGLVLIGHRRVTLQSAAIAQVGRAVAGLSRCAGKRPSAKRQKRAASASKYPKRVQSAFVVLVAFL
jgi:hypothetical protein